MCFSPKSYIVGNNLMSSITLYLLPFEDLSLLDPLSVRNMCKDVYFDTEAIVTINFRGKPPLTSGVFLYKYQQN